MLFSSIRLSSFCDFSRNLKADNVAFPILKCFCQILVASFLDVHTCMFVLIQGLSLSFSLSLSRFLFLYTLSRQRINGQEHIRSHQNRKVKEFANVGSIQTQKDIDDPWFSSHATATKDCQGPFGVECCYGSWREGKRLGEIGVGLVPKLSRLST